jgi:nuclear pore complex protein Nup155
LGELQVAYLGQDGMSLTNVAQCTNIRRKAQSMSPGSRLFEEPQFEIISIHPINSAESQKGRLIVVTTNGARLYFTSTKTNSAEPTSLQLTNIRLPAQQAATIESAPVIDATFYMDGIFMAADKVKPRLSCICPDPAFMNAEQGVVSRQDSHLLMLERCIKSGRPTLQSRGNTAELFGELSVFGKVCAIAEEYQDIPIRMKLNELTASSTIPPRRFLIQTRTGLTVIEKRRPIEILQQLIAEAGSCFDTRAKELQEFIEHYGPVQTYAMCFDLVCTQSPPPKESQSGMIVFITKVIHHGIVTDCSRLHHS